MKKILGIVLAIAPLAVACHGGDTTRTPDQFKSDVNTAIQAKLPDLRACYQTSVTNGDVKGKVTINVRLDTLGTSTTAVWRDNDVPKSEGSSKQLDACVDKILTGIGVSPLDKNFGRGTWSLVFDPDTLDATATPAPAPGSLSAYLRARAVGPEDDGAAAVRPPRGDALPNERRERGRMRMTEAVAHAARDDGERR